jgi:lipopolysaccharide transport system permease protein
MQSTVYLKSEKECVRTALLSRSIKTIIKAPIRELWKLLDLLPIGIEQRAKLDLLKILVKRDLEARYKGSVLGNLWPLLNQLAQLLVYTYVFSIILQVKLNLKGLSSDSFTFGLWLFAGLIPWTAFITGFSQAAGSVIGQPNLVKRVVFPLGLLPLIPILSAFIESSLGLMALITLVALTSHTIHITLWLLPFIWIPQLLLTAGLGYLVAALTVFLRDVPQTIAVLLNLWFYVTPIIYPSHVIPESLRAWVFRLNPLAAIVEVYRDLVLVGQINHLTEWALVWVASVPIFWGGLFVYRQLRPAFADVI